MNKIYLILLCLIVFLCASTVYYIATVDTETLVSEEREFRPSFVGSGLYTKIYDENGTFLYYFQAREMEYFRVNDVSSYIEPYAYNVFQGTRDKSWEVSANKGFFNTDEFITLSDNVVVKNYEKDQSGSGSNLRWWMNTSYLQLDTNTSDISSNQLVHMYDTGLSENHGYDLVGNLETKIFNLKRDCHAIIQPADFHRGN
ncbi:MAG: LPS export ABC transporter periplasmic protein LptC [Succinivibrionaceae bacterium]